MHNPGCKHTNTYISGTGYEATIVCRDCRNEWHRPNAVAGCATCANPDTLGGPEHTPSSRCESGKHPHCSCDTCF